MDAELIKPVIEAVDLSKTFGKKKVLNKVSLSVGPGESLGIFGLRAAGKTTLLYMLAGLETCKTGVIKIMGTDISKSSKYRTSLGLLTQTRSLFQDLTAGENLDYIASLKGAPADSIGPLTEKFELQNCLALAVGSLDAGVYQRLAMACALLNAPRLLVMDEPIKDIDLYSRRMITRAVEEYVSQGGACVCGFSDMSFARHLHKVGWLDNGQLSVYEPGEAWQIWNNMLDSCSGNGEKDD